VQTRKNQLDIQTDHAKNLGHSQIALASLSASLFLLVLSTSASFTAGYTCCLAPVLRAERTAEGEINSFSGNDA